MATKMVSACWFSKSLVNRFLPNFMQFSGHHPYFGQNLDDVSSITAKIQSTQLGLNTHLNNFYMEKSKKVDLKENMF